MGSQPSYRALRAFVETVHAGSAAGAGRRLGVSASAVSHLIRELEAQLQTRLFVAGPKSRLTETGERLNQSIGASFVAIDRALTEMAAPGVHVRLSTVATFAGLWLMPRLPNFLARHPDVRLTISTQRRVVRLGVEPFDCSIRWGRGDWRDAPSKLLFKERLILVGAASSLNRPDENPLEWPRVVALTRPDDWPIFLESIGAEMREPQLVVEDRAAAVQAARLGLGVAVVDRSLVSLDIGQGHLVQLLPETCALEEGFYFVATPGGGAKDAVHALREWALSSADPGSP